MMTSDYFTPPGTNMPMSIKEMLQRSLSIYLSNLTTILKIACCVFVPTQIILGFASKALLARSQEIIQEWNETQHVDDHLFFVVALLLFEIFGCLAYSVAEVATTEITKSTYAGLPKTTVAEAMVVVKSCILRVFLSASLIAIATGISLCLIVPGLFLAVSWWVTTPVIVVERTGVCQSMSKSWELTSGYRCSLFKLFISFVLAFYAAVFVINTFLIVILTPRLIRYVFGFCIPYLSMRPFGYILETVVYFDLRARKESLTRNGLLAEIQSVSGGNFTLSSNVNRGVDDEELMNVAPSVGTNPAWAIQPDDEGGGGSGSGSQGVWSGGNASKDKFDHFEMS